MWAELKYITDSCINEMEVGVWVGMIYLLYKEEVEMMWKRRRKTRKRERRRRPFTKVKLVGVNTILSNALVQNPVYIKNYCNLLKVNHLF